MIVHHNNVIIHIVDGPKPALRYEEIHKAIQPGDKFMMKSEKKSFETRKRRGMSG